MALVLAVILRKQGGGEEWSVIGGGGWPLLRHNRCPTALSGRSFLHERRNLLPLWPGGTERVGKDLRAHVQELHF